MSDSCDCCGTPVKFEDSAAVRCPYCIEQSYIWCSAECRATGGWASHEPHCSGIVRGCPEGTLVAVPYAWQNLTADSSNAWESQELKFPATLVVYDRDPLQQTVKQTVIPGISKPPAQDAAKNAQVDPIKNTSFTVQVNEQSLGPFRAVERVISAKSSDARARSLADARSSSRNARGTTYWVQGSAQLLPGQVNTIRLDKDREVAFYYSDTLADIRGSLGHAMESHLKQQYKFKGLGSGKELRTFLAVNDKTSDSVTLTVNGDNQLVDLEFFASREPRPVKLQTQVFDLKLTDRNPDDVKALCYAIEESGLEHLKQHLPTLKQHLKQLLRDPDTIASNVHDIINIRSTIAEVQRELQQIGRQLSVQDYKDRFTTGDPKTLYARYASEPNGELKTLAAKLFKRVQWRDQLQNQAQKKGFWTSQVSNVRLRVVEQEIKMIKQSLTSMGRALDELIELRNEGASGNLSEDPRLTAWVLLRKRIQELQRENFEMFPEAGATARDIRLKPWDRKNRRPSTSQKTSFSEKQITPIGMTIQKDGFDVRSDQRLYDTDYVNPVDREAWENHLTANLAVYGREMDGKFKVPNVLLEYETGTLLDSRTEEILGELNAYGLQFTDKGVVYSVRTTEPVPGPVDVMTGYTTFFRSFWRNRNPPSSMSSGNSNNSFPLFFVMKVVNTTTEKDQRVGSIMVERDTEVSSIIELLKARYNSLRNLNQNTELYWKPSGAILRRNALVSRYFTGPSVFYFNVDVSVTAAKTFNREFVNVYARKRYDSDEMEEMDLFSDSDEDKRTTAAAPGPRKQKETFPKVPRAFDPSSPADRGGERGGGVLFYGAGDDYDMDW